LIAAGSATFRHRSRGLVGTCLPKHLTMRGFNILSISIQDFLMGENRPAKVGSWVATSYTRPIRSGGRDLGGRRRDGRFGCRLHSPSQAQF